MELQAIRYAAMVSTLTFEKVVDIYNKYLKENNIDSEPRQTILDFLEWSEADEEQFSQDILGYISMFYNSYRLHSYLGYKSPNKFENELMGLKKVA